MIDINLLKKEVQKSGKDNRSILYIKDGEKKRVRFLTDLEEGTAIKFHDSYKLNVNVPCQEVYGRECQHCDNEDLRTRNQYFWTVWDYESKDRKLLMAAVNNCSPVPSMSAMYEEIGTLTDRDYVIKRVGSGQDTTYVLMGMNQEKFKNKKVKPYTEKEILKLIDRMYPDSDGDEEEEEKPKKKANKGGGVKGKMNPPEDDWDDDEEDEMDYESMSAPELYKLCKKRGISCKSKKPKDYYVDLLVDDDTEKEEDEWDEDGELPFE